MPQCANDQAQYHEPERELPAGSLLVLYTDGLIERRGESLDAGFARLTNVLRDAPPSVRDVADLLLRDLLSDGAPADDVALLCVGTTDRDAKLALLLPAAPRQLSGMRRSVNEWLARAGATPEEAREITVAVNEIAANAIEHAYGLTDADFVVEARRSYDTIEFRIRDFGQWRTRRKRSDRGRGLDLARALMDEMEIEAGDDGTTVTMRRRLGHRTDPK
jgi:anti-sigma regulatory factor (Ser/Thr protein kinase)